MNNRLDDNAAVRLYLADALDGVFEHGVEFVVIGFEDHLLGHEVDAAFGNARELGDRILHLRGAVCAVEIFELKCSFHIIVLRFIRLLKSPGEVLLDQ